jgi:hypothetical protein
VGAVIGIRDAGKTKKPPDAHILHSEPTGDGLRFRFRKPFYEKFGWSDR